MMMTTTTTTTVFGKEPWLLPKRALGQPAWGQTLQAYHHPLSPHHPYEGLLWLMSLATPTPELGGM